MTREGIMKLKRTLLLLVAFGAAALVVAFSGCNRGSMGSSGSWGNNYKCTAVNGHPGSHRSMGWSTNRSAAKSSALDKCRAHSPNPGSCRILNCVNESAS